MRFKGDVKHREFFRASVKEVRQAVAEIDANAGMREEFDAFVATIDMESPSAHVRLVQIVFVAGVVVIAINASLESFSWGLFIFFLLAGWGYLFYLVAIGEVRAHKRRKNQPAIDIKRAELEQKYGVEYRPEMLNLEWLKLIAKNERRTRKSRRKG